MNCPSCKAANVVGAAKCVYCGTPLTGSPHGAAQANPFSEQGSPAYPVTEEPIPYAEGVGPSIQNDPALRYVIPIGRSLYAIAAGYLGLLSLGVCFLGPLAIIFGVLAIIDIRRNPEKVGMVRAIFGIVCGVIGSIFLVVVIIAAVLDR